MLLGWRICRKPFAGLSGEGARLVGGRWNSAGRPLLYLGSTPELCALEVRVHLDLPPDLIPDDYVLMSVNLDGLAIEELSTLPADPQGFGDAWLREQRTPLLRVPSAIMPESANWLVNPAHPGASCHIHSLRDFAFDARLWLPLR